MAKYLDDTALSELVSKIKLLVGTKQDTITSSNKLDYSLIANTPTVVDNIQNGNMNAVTSNAVYDAIITKQDSLTAGTGITITNNVISATGTTLTVDTSLSTTSTNPVQNAVITNALNTKLDLTNTGNQIVKGNAVFENNESTSNGYITFATDNTSITDNYTMFYQDVDGGLRVRSGDAILGEQEYVLTPSAFLPDEYDNSSSLGATGKRWKDLYLSGNLTDGTNSISIANIASTSQIPTVNNATLTVQLNGSTIDTFTANASSNKTVNVKALPNYSLSIGSTNGGNPRQVLFCSVNYTNFDSNSGAYFKLGAMSGHGNGSSYTFVEDIFINVNYQGTVTCQVYKYVQQAVTLDSVTRNYGDVFYTIDTTNKIVYFYILLGQYSSAQFTPATKIGAAKAVTSANGIVQNSGTPTYYSSGTKVWATGNSALYVRSSDLATVATTGSYNDLTNKPTIPAAVTSINGLSGGSLTSPLVIKGGDATTAAKLALDQTASGQITNNGTQTLFGFTSNNATSLTVGHSSYTMALRGSGTRPKFNGNDLAMASDSAPSIVYTTTAPSAANASGLKVALLDSEPSTKYAGWIYLIKES